DVEDAGGGDQRVGAGRGRGGDGDGRCALEVGEVGDDLVVVGRGDQVHADVAAVDGQAVGGERADGAVGGGEARHEARRACADGRGKRHVADRATAGQRARAAGRGVDADHARVRAVDDQRAAVDVARAVGDRAQRERAAVDVEGGGLGARAQVVHDGAQGKVAGVGRVAVEGDGGARGGAGVADCAGAGGVARGQFADGDGEAVEVQRAAGAAAAGVDLRAAGQ